MKSKQPADVWDFRALQHEGGTINLGGSGRTQQPERENREVERKGWGTEVGEGPQVFG